MKTSKKTAFYPGTFDPFTIGHHSVVKRALQVFDSIIIAIGVNDAKNCMFSTEQRVKMIKQFYSDIPQIEVINYEGLTVSAAHKAGADAILRGVRSIIDFEYEKNIADFNRDINNIETVLLFTEPRYAHISSSAIRELIRLNQPISKYIPDGLILPSL